MDVMVVKRRDGTTIGEFYISSNADLSGLDLSGVDMRGAKLVGADFGDAELPTFQKWGVTWTVEGIIRIGCEERSVAEWDRWFASDEEFETPRNTADFERIEAAYQHAKRMVEIHTKYSIR